MNSTTCEVEPHPLIWDLHHHALHLIATLLYATLLHTTLLHATLPHLTYAITSNKLMGDQSLMARERNRDQATVRSQEAVRPQGPTQDIGNVFAGTSMVMPPVAKNRGAPFNHLIPSSTNATPFISGIAIHLATNKSRIAIGRKSVVK